MHAFNTSQNVLPAYDIGFTRAAVAAALTILFLCSLQLLKFLPNLAFKLNLSYHTHEYHYMMLFVA